MLSRAAFGCAVISVLGLAACTSGSGADAGEAGATGTETGGGSTSGELPSCGAGQSRFTGAFTLTDLSPGAPAEGEPFEPLLDRPLEILACVDASDDIDPEPLAVGFESTGSLAFYGPGADALSDEIVTSFASLSRIDWQASYQAPDEPQILNFNVWGEDMLPRWLLHVSCAEFEGPGFVGGEVQLAPITCDLAGGRLSRSDANGSVWAEGLGEFGLEP